MPWLAPGEASALIRVESRATTPTLTRPISAANRSTWVEEIGELVLVVLGEACDGGVVGCLVGDDEAKRDVVDQTRLDLARRSRAGGIGIDQKRHHHLGVVRGAAPAVVAPARIERGEIEHPHDVRRRSGRGGPWGTNHR